MSLETHATRVAMLQALGAELHTIDGDEIWALFDEVADRIQAVSGIVRSTRLMLTASMDDVESVQRGALVTIASKSRAANPYKVEDIDNDNGMAIILLAKAH